jgi:hypothetical protein
VVCVALILHAVGSGAALLAAWFWFDSAQVKETDLEFFGRWSDDGGPHKEFFTKAAKKNARAAIASAVAALCFGVGGLIGLLGGS